MTEHANRDAPVSSESGFAGFVRRCAEDGQLVVQPRMGFGDVETMRRGLLAVRDVGAATVGTITLDSFTRVNRHDQAREALNQGHPLNGYPLVAHGPRLTRELLEGVIGDDFPVQVRHGSALPFEIFVSMLSAGVDATEGGPVSYCLPYSRVPLRQAVDQWAASARLLAAMSRPGRPVHLESFGGCMLGQLCPPSLLVALSVLEAMFFCQHGLRSVSLSYAQQTNHEQDLEALGALHRLAAEHLLAAVDHHLVVYTFMGVYPHDPAAGAALLEESAALAVRGRAARLIVKTAAEATRIPTIGENVAALEHAAAVARSVTPQAAVTADTEVYEEARALVHAVLDLDSDLGEALALAFELGLLDVPYCLHRDNRNASRAFIDPVGRLRWAEVGAMPIKASLSPTASGRAGPVEFLDMLNYNVRRLSLTGAASSRLELQR